MNAIAGISKNGVIGKDNKIPWRSKEDMRFFKEKTNGNTLVVGNTTFKSFNGGLPNRKMLVLSGTEIGRRFDSNINCTVDYVSSFDKMTNLIKINEDIGYKCWLAGGTLIYKQFLPMCESLFLTEFDFEVDGDTFFPEFSNIFDARELVKEIENGKIYRYYKNGS